MHGLVFDLRIWSLAGSTSLLEHVKKWCVASKRRHNNILLESILFSCFRINGANNCLSAGCTWSSNVPILPSVWRIKSHGYFCIAVFFRKNALRRKYHVFDQMKAFYVIASACCIPGDAAHRACAHVVKLVIPRLFALRENASRGLDAAIYGGVVFYSMHVVL